MGYVALAARLEESREDFQWMARIVRDMGVHVRFVIADHDPQRIDQVATPSLEVTSATVERALADAATLLERRDAVRGVDRAHTAFHGYLRAIIQTTGLPAKGDENVVQLFKLIVTTRPANRRPRLWHADGVGEGPCS